MRTMLALLALLALASPLAAAQDATDEKKEDGPARPEDAAWVEDCPPDMMCAYAGESAEGENATYGDCGGEVCASDAGEPVPHGPEDCIECSAPPRDDGVTCMDGAQEGEACLDDVQYLDGGAEPARGPADGSCESCRGEDLAAESAETNAVPLPQLFVVLAALAGAVLVVRRA